jgi:hypothetical protein
VVQCQGRWAREQELGRQGCQSRVWQPDEQACHLITSGRFIKQNVCGCAPPCSNDGLTCHSARHFFSALHPRAVQPALTPEDPAFPQLDFVCISHNHYDHLDTGECEATLG